MTIDDRLRDRRARPTRGLLTGEADAKRLHAESLTGLALGQLPDDWAVISDLRWPGGKYGHVDHVVVGPSGIYVIDTQPWFGQVTVHGGHLRHDGHVEDAVIKRVSEAATAVSLLVGSVPKDLVKPVVVCVGDDPLNEKVAGVRLVDVATLAPALEARQHAMSTHQVERARQQLAEHLNDARVVRVAAKAGRVQRKREIRPGGRIRRIPVIRIAIAAWFLATAVLAPQVFADGYSELVEFVSRQVNRF
jgi:hypothetical protein